MKRTCGECRACCISLVIPEYPPAGKPAGEPCKHLCATGCGVYANNREKAGLKLATTCNGFNCGWILGFGEEADRPDESGAILIRDRPDLPGFTAPVSVFETTAGSLTRPPARRVINAALKTGRSVVLITLDGKATLATRSS